MASQTLDSLKWLRRRYGSPIGTVRVVRRALSEFRSGGLRRIRQHYSHAASAERRERRYQEWIRQCEPGVLRAFGAHDAPESESIFFSIIVPCFNTPRVYLERCIESVSAQSYSRWELILVDDASETSLVEETVRRFASGDDRIRILSLDENRGIAGATNAGLETAKGEFVAFLDHDDELTPDCLRCLAHYLNEQSDLDLVYTDEDKIDDSGRRHSPAFKPGFSPHHLWSTNYICHLLVMRTSLVRDRLNGLRSEFDGAQDYDLILRATETTQRIGHLPLVLYHWRSHDDSTAGAADGKPYALEAGRKALSQSLERQGIASDCADGPAVLTFRPSRKNRSKQGIHVVLCRGTDSGCDQEQIELVDEFAKLGQVESIEIFERSAVLAGGATCDSVSDSIVEHLVDAKGRRNLFLVVDAGLSADWDDVIDRFLSVMRFPHTGMTGPCILDRNGHVDNAGLIINPDDRMAHRMAAGLSANDPGYLWSQLLMRNVSCADPGFFMINREEVIRSLELAPSSERAAIRNLMTLGYWMRRAGSHSVIDGQIRIRRRRPSNLVRLYEQSRIPERYGNELLNPSLRWIEPRMVPSAKSQ